MNRDQFLDYLQHPEQLDHDSLVDLDELVRAFPFCQPAQVLLLKNLQNQGNIRFNKHLKITAAYSFDRSLLYSLLHEYHDPEQPVDTRDRDQNAASGIRDATFGVPEPEREPEFEPDPEPESEIETVTSPVWEDVESKEPVAEEEPILTFDDWTSPTGEQRTESPLKSWPEVEGKSEYIKRIEQIIPIVDIDLLVFDFPNKTEADLLTFEYEKRTPDFIRLAAEEESLPPEERNTSRELIRDFLENDPLSRFEINLEPIIHLPEPELEEPSVPAPSSPQTDLIDQFIQGGQSRLIRPKEGAKEVEDLSIRSLQEDDNLLTETLATIFVQQKYYLKAIQAYEKLSLKFPEKSIYFASQIEKVKELIKNQ